MGRRPITVPMTINGVMILLPGFFQMNDELRFRTGKRWLRVPRADHHPGQVGKRLQYTHHKQAAQQEAEIQDHGVVVINPGDKQQERGQQIAHPHPGGQNEDPLLGKQYPILGRYPAIQPGIPLISDQSANAFHLNAPESHQPVSARCPPDADLHARSRPGTLPNGARPQRAG